MRLPGTRKYARVDLRQAGIETRGNQDRFQNETAGDLDHYLIFSLAMAPTCFNDRTGSSGINSGGWEI
jgi:hypothetical protein